MTQARIDRTRARMDALGVDVLLLSVGADLPWLTGYEAMPLERLTMFVLPREGEATLVVPGLEAPRVRSTEGFELRPWGETEDPVAIVASLMRAAGRAAIGPHTWARFLLALQDRRPGVQFIDGTTVTSPLRSVKDADEIAALTRAAAAIDSVIAAMRERPFAGRTEADVAHEIADRILGAGHDRVNFTIVASGPNSASPHHDPSDRVIEDGDPVLLDIGGTLDGYCSDITRMYSVGEPSAPLLDTYAVLEASHDAGVRAGAVGVACEAVDTASRAVIDDAGFGAYFVHRTGHGIGTEAHEDPYMVQGNTTPIMAGYAFSVEPGIYLPGEFGIRLEDIVVATEAGPQMLNHAARDIAVVG